MIGNEDADERTALSEIPQFSRRNGNRRRVRPVIALASLAGAFFIATASAAWLGSKAAEIDAELTAVVSLIPTLKEEMLTEDNTHEAVATVDELRAHTAAAKKAAMDPLWTLVSVLPVFGSNFSAISEVTRSVDDVAGMGLAPLVNIYSSLNWETLLPTGSNTDLEPLIAASPSMSAAADAVRMSADRLSRIETAKLLPQVSDPLISGRDQLSDLARTLDAAADATKIAPLMLGAQAPRDYLLIVQNNAETRASGGIPGALAVVNLDEGKLTLGLQTGAGAVGVMSPVVPVDHEQQQIYSQRMGKYMQDVNLTPDFPTAASTAKAMWERKTGQRVDGVISIDPVALSYILDGTGPVRITNDGLIALGTPGMPTELTGQNVVKTLLSDVYEQIEQPALQDAYFAGVAQEAFAALASGQGNAKGLIKGITRGAAEGRVLIWSASPAEQSVLVRYALSGSIAGASVSPAQFGVYFNDGTGAKMDYYVKRTVQLLKECPRGGYEQTTVRITSTNTAPLDAALSLPKYVTGDGDYGVPAGSVQTNIVAYGPVQAVVETATLDGQRVGFAPYLHANRPVGVVSIRLAPGETRTVDMTFGRIVQHTEPNIVVTPTVQDVNDVLLPVQSASCG